MIEDARAWASRMLFPVQKSSFPMSPLRPEPKVTVLMVNSRKKSRLPEKESEKRSNRVGRGDRRREVDSTFHPLLGHTTASTYTSTTNNFEGSTEGSAEGSAESSGVGQDHAPDQDGISTELSDAVPRNRELTSSRRTVRNEGVVSPPDQTHINNVEGFDDDDEDNSSGVEELTGLDGDHESSGKAALIYDSIGGYPGIGTTMDSDKNFGDTLGKSQTPKSYDEDEYTGKDGGTGGSMISDEEDIGSDGEEDSYEGIYPDNEDVSSGSDTEEMVSAEDMGSGGEDSSGEGSGQS